MQSFYWGKHLWRSKGRRSRSKKGEHSAGLTAVKEEGRKDGMGKQSFTLQRSTAKASAKPMRSPPEHRWAARGVLHWTEVAHFSHWLGALENAALAWTLGWIPQVQQLEAVSSLHSLQQVLVAMAATSTSHQQCIGEQLCPRILVIITWH